MSTADCFIEHTAHTKVFAFAQSNAGERAVYGINDLFIGFIRQTKSRVVIQILKNTQFLDQQIILGHVAKNTFNLVLFAMNVVSVDGYLAVGRSIISIEDI